MGKPRPYHTKSGHAFQPARGLRYEELIRLRFMEAYPGFRILPKGTGVKLSVVAVVAIPKLLQDRVLQLAKAGMGLSRKAVPDELVEELLAKAKAIALATVAVKRPDLDNVAKILQDSLTGVVWYEDSCVVELRIRRVYGEDPGLSVVIEVLDQG